MILKLFTQQTVPKFVTFSFAGRRYFRGNGTHKPFCVIHSKLSAFGDLLSFNRTRYFCTQASKVGLVYNSASDDVFENLAFEDWIFNNTDLSSVNVLFLWRNKPCIVIGRHQNPWAECNLRYLQSSNFKLARRRSGGGTVFHDHGNLNCTFFTSKNGYNRKSNLNLVVSGIKRIWPTLDLEVNERDDIVLNKDFKISGTAAKLTNKLAYHHFTLLHNTNVKHLKEALNVNTTGLTNRATPSVPSLVRNLSDASADINHENLMSAICEEFYRCYPPYVEGKNYLIDPRDESSWPGITKYQDELKSWEWIYGKTPNFSIEKSGKNCSLLIHVRKGRIDGIIVKDLSDWTIVDAIQQLTARLKNVPFRHKDISMQCKTIIHETKYDGRIGKTLEDIIELIQEDAS